MKNIRIFHLKIFNFLVKKFSVYLNRRVFVMLLKMADNLANASRLLNSIDSCIFFKVFYTLCDMEKGSFGHMRTVRAQVVVHSALRKHAYSNILKILPPKSEKNQIKNSNIFHSSAKNIDCGYLLEPPQWGGSNKYPHSMFLSRNKKNNVYPWKPQFYNIKVGFKGVKII